MTSLSNGVIRLSNTDQKLLTRDEFRSQVFLRDNHKCVFCGDPEGIVAHHIIERRLYDDGGYYLNNGASVCPPCHIKCETTEYSVEDVRIACGIVKPVLPPQLYDDQPYDKWGNPILANKQRVRGELFFDESVQKILKQGGKLDLFTNHVKYPRTFHVPWTLCANKDDKTLPNMNHFIGQEVVVTTKIDGENTTMYSDHIHARSVDSDDHLSRHWVKNFWSKIRYEIPDQHRICGENAYALHSIKYDQLPSYFMGFSFWGDRNNCLSWDDTQLWFELLGITSVPVLYRGIYNEQLIKSLWQEKDWEHMEGYVIRLAREFSYGEFRKSVAKFVRPNHVQTVKHHWASQPVVPNKLIE